MKSNSAKLKILLDTSFLLPTLGISVSGDTQRGIEILAETEGIEIYYSRFSILESLWVATRTIHDDASYVESLGPGLRSIMEEGRYRLVEEDSEIFREAFSLFRLGHKDMIDNMLCATAARHSLYLLTVDEELRKFILEKQLKDKILLMSVEALAFFAQTSREGKDNNSSRLPA